MRQMWRMGGPNAVLDEDKEFDIWFDDFTLIVDRK